MILSLQWPCQRHYLWLGLLLGRTGFTLRTCESSSVVTTNAGEAIVPGSPMLVPLPTWMTGASMLRRERVDLE